MSVITFPGFKPQTFTLKKIRNQGTWREGKKKKKKKSFYSLILDLLHYQQAKCNYCNLCWKTNASSSIRQWPPSPAQQNHTWQKYQHHKPGLQLFSFLSQSQLTSAQHSDCCLRVTSLEIFLQLTPKSCMVQVSPSLFTPVYKEQITLSSLIFPHYILQEQQRHHHTLMPVVPFIFIKLPMKSAGNSWSYWWLYIKYSRIICPPGPPFNTVGKALFSEGKKCWDDEIKTLY